MSEESGLTVILQSLDKFNESRLKLYSISNEPILNGIACPSCGEELYDSEPMITLASYPPKKTIHL